jgi:hypothetical protein
MIKLVTLTAVSIALAFAPKAFAAETKEVTRTVTIYSLSDNPKFAEQVKAICDDKAIKLSDKARTACVTGNFPNLTKSLRFRNAGIGAEFNTLAAQR